MFVTTLALLVDVTLFCIVFRLDRFRNTLIGQLAAVTIGEQITWPVTGLTRLTE